MKDKEKDDEVEKLIKEMRELFGESMSKMPMSIKEHWDLYEQEYLTEGMPLELRAAIKQAFYMAAFAMYGIVSFMATKQQMGSTDSQKRWDGYRKEIDDYLDSTPCITFRSREDIINEYIKKWMN
jgi:hypothetical protein